MPEPLRIPAARDLLPQAAELPPNRPTGLFAELLVDRPEPLYVDSLEHPNRYEDDARTLVEQLAAQNRPITEEERQLLDRATYVFATSTTRKGEAPKPTIGAARRRRDEVEEELENEEMPLEELPRFWWKR